MRFGIFLLTHDSGHDIDRALFSLHNQSHRAWGGHILDIESSDDITRHTFPVSAILHCQAIRGKMQVHRLDSSDKFAAAVDGILGRPPYYHVVVFAGCHIRFDFQLLETVRKHFDGEADVVQVSVDNYWEDAPIERLIFCRNEVAREHIPDLAGEAFTQVRYMFLKTTRIKAIGKKAFATSFHAPPYLALERRSS